MNIIKNLKTIWLINITINNEILKKYEGFEGFDEWFNDKDKRTKY
jgi:hypothetical protein